MSLYKKTLTMSKMKPTKTEAKPETPEQKDLRAKRCANEIEAVCLKYNCVLNPNAVLTKDGIRMGLDINAN